MDISEIGNSIQIRITYEDAERLRAMKVVPEQPWHKALNNLLKENDDLKKEVKDLKRQLHLKYEIKLTDPLASNELKVEQIK